jgi:hypothetical protein
MEVYNKIKTDLGFMIILWLAIVLIGDSFEIGWDSTDGQERSGMSLHVDNLTGCHYLGGKSGGITPRLNNNGEQICNGL